MDFKKLMDEASDKAAANHKAADHLRQLGVTGLTIDILKQPKVVSETLLKVLDQMEVMFETHFQNAKTDEEKIEVNLMAVWCRCGVAHATRALFDNNKPAVDDIGIAYAVSRAYLAKTKEPSNDQTPDKA